MDIREALDQLDPLDDSHWTEEGHPALGAVKAILGSEVTRKQVIDAAPDFSRDSCNLPDPFEGMSQIEKDEAIATAEFEELQAAILKKQKEISVLRDELDVLNSKAMIMDLHLERIRRARGKTQSTAIQEYLAQVRKSRMAKAARLTAFAANGVAIKDLVASMNPRSRIDQALNQRKAAPGSTRPSPSLPVRR